MPAFAQESTPNQPHPKDLEFAEFFCRTTQRLKRVPPLDNLIVGRNVIPQGWQVLDLTPDQVGVLPWTQFRGDRWGFPVPIPRLYKRVGVVSIDAVEMGDLRDADSGAHDAVAARFGTVAVVGAFGDGLRFSPDPQDGDRLLAGGRVGRGALQMCVGTYNHLTEEFTPVEDQYPYGHEGESREMYDSLPLSKAPKGLL